MSVATADGGGYPEIPDVPERVLRLVTDESLELEATLNDIDDALAGEDYDAIMEGYGATLSGTEERLAALAVRPLIGGKSIYEV
jgi:hypothetical protein